MIYSVNFFVGQCISLAGHKFSEFDWVFTAGLSVVRVACFKHKLRRDSGSDSIVVEQALGVWVSLFS